MHHQFINLKLSLDFCYLGFKQKNIHIKLNHQKLCHGCHLSLWFWSRPYFLYILKFWLPNDLIWPRTGPPADVVRIPLASWHAPGEDVMICLAKGDISFPWNDPPKTDDFEISVAPIYPGIWFILIWIYQIVPRLEIGGSPAMWENLDRIFAVKRKRQRDPLGNNQQLTLDSLDLGMIGVA